MSRGETAATVAGAAVGAAAATLAAWVYYAEHWWIPSVAGTEHDGEPV